MILDFKFFGLCGTLSDIFIDYRVWLSFEIVLVIIVIECPGELFLSEGRSTDFAFRESATEDVVAKIVTTIIVAVDSWHWR